MADNVNDPVLEALLVKPPLCLLFHVKVQMKWHRMKQVFTLHRAGDKPLDLRNFA
jgi:hypothetical protein